MMSVLGELNEKRQRLHEKLHTAADTVADAVLPPTVRSYVDTAKTLAPPPLDPIDLAIGIYTEGPDYLKKKALEPFLSPVEYTEFTPTDPFTGGSSDPVYYVNGAATNFAGASNEAQALSNQLFRTVRLIHNPTEMSTPLFPVSLNASATSVAGFFGDMGQAAADRLYMFPGFQHNPTTKMVSKLFYDAYENNEKISIVAHSQGTLIVNAAMRTMQALGPTYKSWVLNNLKVVFTGVPMTREELAKDPNDSGSNIKPYVNEGDIFAESVGYSIGGRYGFFDKILLKGMPALKQAAATHDFVGSYVFQLDNQYLWGDGGKGFGPDSWDSSSANDSPDTAKDLGEIYPASTRSASLIPLSLHTDVGTGETTDVDWLKFKVTDGTLGPDTLIWLSFPNSQSDIDLYVAKGKSNAKDGNWIVQSTATDTPYEAVSLAGLGIGTYYVRIDSDNGVPADYRLSYQLRPQFARDRSEPNNNADDARFLGVGAKQQSPLDVTLERNLHTAGDEDWYYFRLQEAIAPGSQVSLSFDNDAGDIDMELYGEQRDGSLELIDTSESTDDEEAFDLSSLELAPGYYYVRVYGAPLENVVNSYELTLDLPAPTSVPPVFSKGVQRQPTSVPEGDLIYIDFPAKDPNGDIIDFTLAGQVPQGMEINGHSGKVRYASKIGDGGKSFDIVVVAKDTKGKSSKSKMRVYVEPAKPTITDVRTENASITNAGVDPVTMIASGVYFPFKNGGVRFTLDSNGDGLLSDDDAALGIGKQIAPGLYRWDGRVRGNVAPGSYKIFAQASRDTFDGTLVSDPVSTSIEIMAAPPTVQLAIPDGGDQRVSAEGSGDVRRGLVTQDDAGNRYVFFTASANNNQRILMQRYDFAGTPLGTAVTLDVGGSGINDVAMRGNGEFVLTNIGFDGSFQPWVYARRFDAAGNPLSDLLRTHVTDVGSDGTFRHSRVGMDDEGDFVLVWTQGNYTQEDIYYRRFNAANEPLDADPVPVHPPTDAGQRDPDVAMVRNGDFVVVWLDVATHQVLGRRFSNQGVAGQPFIISVDSSAAFGDSRDIAVQTTPSGGFLAAWRGTVNNDEAVLIRQYDAKQVPLLQKETRVDSFSNSFSQDIMLSVGPTGHAAIAFSIQDFDPNDGPFENGVYGQLIGPQGEKLGDNFKIPDVDAGNQSVGDISVDADADLFAVWNGDLPSEGGGGPGGPGGGDTKAVFFRRFSVNLAPDSFSRLEGVTKDSQRSFAPTSPDPDGDTLVVTKIGDQPIQSGQSVNLPSGAEVRLENNGKLTYLPPAQGQVGSIDSFSYTVQDGKGGESRSTAMFVLADPLSVRSVQPALEAAPLPFGVSNIQLEFNQPVKNDVDAADLELRAPGPDRLFGSPDDVLIPVTPSVLESRISLSFMGLVAGNYRLTLKDSIHDSDDQKLDGNADRQAGGNFVREFKVGQVSAETIVSPTGVTIQVGTSSTNMGQLVGGASGVFDGLNQLNIGGTEYAPVQGLLTAGLVTETPLQSDGTYHDLGLRTSFVAAGGPVRINLLLQARHEASLSGRFAFRFVLDGNPLSEYMADLEGNSNAPTNSLVHLEEYLEVVAPGSHMVSVEARSTGATHNDLGLVAGADSRLNVWQFAPQDNGDPSVVLHSVPQTSDLILTTDGGFHDVGLQTTFRSNGGPVRLSLPLQIFNQSGADQQVTWSLLVDDVSVATSTLNVHGVGRAEGSAIGQLEALLKELPAGDHMIKLQGKSLDFIAASSAIRLGGGPILTILQPQPVPGMDFRDLVDTTTFDHDFFPTTDGAFHALEPNLPFHSDGNPIRLSVPLSVTNLSDQPQTLTLRLTVDGDPLREYTLDLDPNGNQGIGHTVNLEEFLVNEMPIGDHTIEVELKTAEPIADPNRLRVDTGTVLTVERLTNIAVAGLKDGGQTVVTPEQTVNGITVHREVTTSVASGSDFVRTVETFVNPSSNPSTISIQLASNLGSDERTTVFATSDGDAIVEADDWWVGMDDEDGLGTPAVIHILRSPYSPPAQFLEVQGDTISWKLSAQIPANSTRHVATFTVTAEQRAEALESVQSLVQTAQLSEVAVEGMTIDDVQTLANFVFPLPPVQLELTNDTVVERVAGAVVGDVRVVDPVAGQTYAFAVNDPRFDVIQGKLRIRDGSFVRAQNDATLSVEILVTNSATPPQQVSARFDLKVDPNPTPWRNPTKPLDVSNDGVVVPLDALVLINLLNDSTSNLLEDNGSLPEARPRVTSLAYLDANGDGFCTPIDVLKIINFLNGVGGESEFGKAPAADLWLAAEAWSPEKVDSYFAELGPEVHAISRLVANTSGPVVATLGNAATPARRKTRAAAFARGTSTNGESEPAGDTHRGQTKRGRFLNDSATEGT